MPRQSSSGPDRPLEDGEEGLGMQELRVRRTTLQIERRPDLPSLHLPKRRRKLFFIIGLVAILLDLGIFPITYYYALVFGTSLSLQDIFAVITGVFGLISFTHYAFRTWKLFWTKTSPLYRPIGWKSWALLEVTQVSIAGLVTLIEIELVIGTIPTNPIIRLCAMPSATICYYFGFFFLGSAIFTQLKWTLPFPLSSTPKGKPWVPVLLALIEDIGSLEGRGQVDYRVEVLKRYEKSPAFRLMLLRLSYMWGIALILTAIGTTIIVALLKEHLAFGIGWGLPFALSGFYAIITYFFVKSSLHEERINWRIKMADIERSESSREASQATSRDVPPAPQEAAQEAPQEAPQEVAQETPQETTKETPKEIPKESPKEASQEA